MKLETSLLVGMNVFEFFGKSCSGIKAYMGDTTICLVYVLLKVRKEACKGC